MATLVATCDGDDPKATVIKHVTEMLKMAKCLNEDVEEAGELFRFVTHEFAARTCIRTLFSELEAKIFLLHKLVLALQPFSQDKLSPEETMLLKETLCSVGANGNITNSQKYIPFKNKLLFTLNLCAQRFNPNVYRDTSDPRWQDVLALIKIRNRITHPKSMNDLAISQHEVDTFNSGQEWLREAFGSMFFNPDLFIKK